MASGLATIPARRGKAALVGQGQLVTVVNTHGSQVVDTWAFSAVDSTELMSMEHTRPSLMNLRPRVGDALATNRRRPILTLVEDTSSGVHDTLMAACDRPRYELLGVTEYHNNCTDNLAAALGEVGLRGLATPAPLNLFMSVPWAGDGALSWAEPESRPGDHVVFRAEMELIVAFSACPQDILPVNGRLRVPTEAHFGIS